MALREFHALADRCKNQQDWLNSRTALLCAVVVNMWRDPKKPAAKAEDFMPGQHKKQEQQTAEQMLANVRMINAAHGGKVVTETNFSEN